MKPESLKIGFFIRKARQSHDIENPVYGRIVLGSDISEFATQQYIPVNFTGSLQAFLKSQHASARQLEIELIKIRHAILDVYYKRIGEDDEMSAKRLKKAFLGKDAEERNSLLQLFERHNELHKVELAKGTLTKYNTCLKHLKKFIQAEYNKDDLPIKEVNKKFIYLFELYLRNTACSKNTTLKYLQTLKKIVRQALDFGYITEDPFYNFKFRFEKREREYLSEQELASLENKVLTCERIEKVRDVFVFCCYTGLAYADVKELTQDHLSCTPDGKIWISKNREKTGIKSKVPLLPKALEILKKYSDDPYCRIKGSLLPVNSNQRMNAYLKEIADLCGIKKELSTHIARHTFATTVTLMNGMPLETVSKMLGHTNLKTTMIYAKISDNKVAADMDLLFKKFARD